LTTRVIGMGAEDRGDDAAGLLVARLLRALAPAGVEVHESAGDAGGLLGLLEGAERVVLVDAARGGGAPGTAEPTAIGAALRPPVRSTHGLGLVEALGVASAPGILPPVVSVYVVHGRRFEPGPPTPEVAAGITAAAELILLRDELGRTPAGPRVGERR
jgi:hydrogenase maturation protease